MDVLNSLVEILEFVREMKLGQTSLKDINDRIELIEHIEASIVEREIDETLKYRILHVVNHVKNLLLSSTTPTHLF